MGNAMLEILLIILIIISIIIGAIFLYKYKKTKQKKFLWLGLVLSFVVPGILILILFWWIYTSAITCYAPVSDNGYLSTIIGLPLFIKQRDRFVNKFKNQVSKDVFDKISKKKK